MDQELVISRSRPEQGAILIVKFVFLLLVTATVTRGFYPAQSVGAGDATQIFKVRLLNGKTGKPIKNEAPNIWFGDAKSPINSRTNADGEVTVAVTDAQLQELRVLPNWYADCRYKGDSVAGMSVKYPLKEIITTGVVSANVCGNNQIDPTPRVLILYVRPKTFMERVRL
jgi:hypothetical protein